jgi:hypothetical protein
VSSLEQAQSWGRFSQIWVVPQSESWAQVEVGSLQMPQPRKAPGATQDSPPPQSVLVRQPPTEPLELDRLPELEVVPLELEVLDPLEVTLLEPEPLELSELLALAPLEDESVVDAPSQTPATERQPQLLESCEQVKPVGHEVWSEVQSGPQKLLPPSVSLRQ